MSEHTENTPLQDWMTAMSRGKLPDDRMRACTECREPYRAKHLDDCLGCDRTDLCIRCMRDHRCGG